VARYNAVTARRIPARASSVNARISTSVIEEGFSAPKGVLILH